MTGKNIRILLLLGMAAVICGTAGAAGMGIVAEPHETSGVEAPPCAPPCECMSLTEAMQRWGTEGYEYCSKTVCGQSADAMVQYYCLHQKAGPAAVATPQAQATLAAAAQGAGQKSPAGIVPVVAAIGIALLAAPVLRRE